MKTEAELHAEFVRLCESDTPEVVAKRIGISPSYVSEILNKRRAVSKRVALFFGYKPLKRQPLERLFVEAPNNSQNSA